MPLLGSHAISTAVRDVHRVRGEPALPDKRALPGPQIKEAKRSIDLFASTALLLSRLVTTFSSFFAAAAGFFLATTFFFAATSLPPWGRK